MNAAVAYPEPAGRGVVNVNLTRENLLALLAMDNTRHVGTPGLVSVDDDLVVVVSVGGGE